MILVVHQKVTNPTKEYKLEAFIDEAGPNNKIITSEYPNLKKTEGECA